MADAQKTEKATPKKRQDERKKGNIFFSNDAVSVAVLIASLFTLYLTAGMLTHQLQYFMQYCLEMTSLQSVSEFQGGLADIFIQFLATFLKSIGPLVAVCIITGIAITFFQTKMLVTLESLKPKFDRLNPIQGVQRLFSLRSIIEALKGLLKISILLYLVFNCLSGAVKSYSKYMFIGVAEACTHLFGEAFSLVMQIGLAYIVLAGFDIFYQWWDYERQLRMSKEEIKEEYKQMEGDPKVKGKIKEIQRKMAQSRMMQQVPQADVVIRNPTHFAVALRYRPEKDVAPLVLAKGQDELALRIVSKAEECSITVIENVPLARALYASSEVNRPIPPELYNAVAEVLVYLYRMDKKLKS